LCTNIEKERKKITHSSCCFFLFNLLNTEAFPELPERRESTDNTES
jgi:hypothetical protein